MLSRAEFIRVSLESNLLFQRIMKEHLFFIETSLQPVENDRIKEADLLKRSFEELLFETVMLSNESIGKNALESHEFVTKYTLEAEKAGIKLTGASLNTEITKAELKLKSNPNFDYNEWLESCVSSINQRSINLLGEVIDFQEKILELTLKCKIAIAQYPELLGHITAEAILYLETLEHLQKKTLPEKTLCQELDFWNRTMGEHARFIDGMLDPTETELKATIQKLASTFELLVKQCRNTPKHRILQESLKATEAIQNFKEAATKGLLKCEIKSMIPALLADHVLREANHYLRLLRNTCK